MLKISKRFLSFFSLFLLPAALLLAAEPPLELRASFDLTESLEDTTFFEVMAYEIKPELDVDYYEPFTIVDVETFWERVTNFHRLPDYIRSLNGGEDGLTQIIENIEGEEVVYDQLYFMILDVVKELDLFRGGNARRRSRFVGSLVPVVAMTSGRGTHVQLDEETYAYNVGYAKGSGGTDYQRDKEDRRTGRSYGASNSKNAYDATDKDYLQLLGQYFSSHSEEELVRFYTTLFQILLKVDTSGIQYLSEMGQTLMVDFVSVYMAELDRHLMTGLKRYEWENALTEITMLAAYSANPEGTTFDPRTGASNENGRQLAWSAELTPKQLMVGFFGVGTDGTGLDGRNKRRRHILTRHIVGAMKEIRPVLVAEIQDLIMASSRSDIYDKTMEFINDYETQEQVKANADYLIELLVEFVMETRYYAADISDIIFDSANEKLDRR